jgi:hypothetical protein
MQITENLVKDLTVDQLKQIIRETIIESLSDCFNDPDANLTIKPEIEEQLLAMRQRRKHQKTSIPAAEVYQTVGCVS